MISGYTLMALIHKELLQVMRDKRMLVVLLVVPVIFALVEKVSFRRKVPVLVRNQPEDLASAQVVNG